MAQGIKPGRSLGPTVGIPLFTYVGYMYLDKTQGNYAHFTENIDDVAYLRIGSRDADTSTGLSNLSLILNNTVW